MLKIDGANPRKYGLNVAKAIFDEEELVDGAILSGKQQTTRNTLDQVRVNLLKGK